MIFISVPAGMCPRAGSENHMHYFSFYKFGEETP